MKVINLWAGPGAGKSTTAAGVFHRLKLLGHKAELVTEYAKDLTWERNQCRLNNSLVVFAEQYHRLARLRDHDVDWAVTDSPFPMGALYGDPPGWLRTALWAAFDEFENLNYFIQRVKPYVPVGRNQTEDEARVLDRRIFCTLDAREAYLPVKGDELAAPIIVSHALGA